MNETCVRSPASNFTRTRRLKIGSSTAPAELDKLPSNATGFRVVRLRPMNFNLSVSKVRGCSSFFCVATT